METRKEMECPPKAPPPLRIDEDSLHVGSGWQNKPEHSSIGDLVSNDHPRSQRKRPAAQSSISQNEIVSIHSLDNGSDPETHNLDVGHGWKQENVLKGVGTINDSPQKLQSQIMSLDFKDKCDESGKKQKYRCTFSGHIGSHEYMGRRQNQDCFEELTLGSGHPWLDSVELKLN
jgi:hypothetical protein